MALINNNYFPSCELYPGVELGTPGYKMPGYFVPYYWVDDYFQHYITSFLRGSPEISNLGATPSITSLGNNPEISKELNNEGSII